MEKKSLVKYRIMNVISILLSILGTFLLFGGGTLFYFDNQTVKGFVDLIITGLLILSFIGGIVISVVAFVGSKKVKNKIDIISLLSMIITIFLPIAFLILIVLATIFLGGVFIMYGVSSGAF